MVIIMMTILNPTDLNSFKTDRAGHIFNRWHNHFFLLGTEVSVVRVIQPSWAATIMAVWGLKSGENVMVTRQWETGGMNEGKSEYSVYRHIIEQIYWVKVLNKMAISEIQVAMPLTSYLGTLVYFKHSIFSAYVPISLFYYHLPIA